MLYLRFVLYSLLTVPSPMHQAMTTHYTPLLFQAHQILYLIWQEILQAPTSIWEAFKSSKMIHLWCKFHANALNLWF